MDCYIYFKALSSKEQQVMQQVAALQTSMCETLQQALPEYVTHSAAQNVTRSALQRRPEVAQGLHTWMEVYRDIPQDFADLMTKALLNSQLMPLIEGERHMEFFIPVELPISPSTPSVQNTASAITTTHQR